MVCLVGDVYGGLWSGTQHHPLTDLMSLAQPEFISGVCFVAFRAGL